MPNRIFISYTTRDNDGDPDQSIGRTYAHALQQAIDREDGFSAFMDAARIDASVNWDTNIADAMHTAHGAIVLVSEKSAESEWVRSEVGFFRTRNLATRGQFVLVVVEIGPNASAATQSLMLDHIQTVQIEDATQVALAHKVENPAALSGVVTQTLLPLRAWLARFDDDLGHIQYVAECISNHEVNMQALVKLSQDLEVEIDAWVDEPSLKALYAKHVVLALVEIDFNRACSLLHKHLQLSNPSRVAWMLAAFQTKMASAQRFHAAVMGPETSIGAVASDDPVYSQWALLRADCAYPGLKHHALVLDPEPDDEMVREKLFDHRDEDERLDLEEDLQDQAMEPMVFHLSGSAADLDEEALITLGATYPRAFFVIGDDRFKETYEAERRADLLLTKDDTEEPALSSRRWYRGLRALNLTKQKTTHND